MQHSETAEQAAVFEAYYALGVDRSLAKLHDQFTKVSPTPKKVPSLRTLKNWSRWFNWQQRVVIKDKAVAAGIDKKTTKDIINRKAEYLELVDALIDSCFERGKDGNPKLKFEIEKPKDLKEAVELALKLMGEPEHVEHLVSFEWLDGED